MGDFRSVQRLRHRQRSPVESLVHAGVSGLARVASITHHEFYWDLPDTSKVIRHTVIDPAWATRNPPTPAIVMGQAPNLNGASWGGYPGWEEFNGIIRGIQIYSGLLSVPTSSPRSRPRSPRRPAAT